MKLSHRKIFTILLFLTMLILTFRPIADPDFWWHLRTGELIVETHSIPHTDPFSFTVAGKPWIAHEWLSELTIFLLFQLGGYGLLILVFGVIITLSFYLTYLRTSSRSRPYIAGFALLLATLATAPTWGVRPQMISLLFSALFLLLLERFQASRSLRYILFLPLITILWVNLHAGFALGLGIVTIYIVGDIIGVIRGIWIKTIPIHWSSFKNIIWMIAILIVCMLFVAVNPNGIHLYTYPFETLISPSMQQFIQEWASPDFHQAEWQPLAWLILALFGAGLWGRKSISVTSILLVLIFGYAALRSTRNVPQFAIIAAPIIADEVDTVVQIKSADIKNNHPVYWLGPILIILTLFVAGLRFISINKQQLKIEQDNFPVSAVNWILQYRPDGNIYNTYGWGGYLIWRLYPDYRVYIDGRADVYGDRFIYNYMDVYLAQLNWDKTLANNNVRLVIIEPGSGLAGALKNTPDWEMTYEDKISVIYVKK
jgi:hypothetical protein